MIALSPSDQGIQRFGTTPRAFKFPRYNKKFLLRFAVAEDDSHFQTVVHHRTLGSATDIVAANGNIALELNLRDIIS